jgi:hypothetical protein
MRSSCDIGVLCQHAQEVSIVGTDIWPVAGIAGGLASAKAAVLVAIGLSASTFGGGLILGARIAIPALVVALIGWWQTPNLVSIGWLKPGDPSRKIGFIICSLVPPAPGAPRVS